VALPLHFLGQNEESHEGLSGYPVTGPRFQLCTFLNRLQIHNILSFFSGFSSEENLGNRCVCDWISYLKCNHWTT
jgi:hypothetical protein